jgi:pimeloyl-ACP methyl ester carboxylesterase
MRLQGVAIVKPFDYKKNEQDEDKSNRWVADADTAQRLAKTVVCYSRLYGGKKVVIVAHSMGGLLTREMLSWAAYGTFAKSVTGHVITIGTPHEGSRLANIDASFWRALCKAPIGVFSLTDDIDALCRQANFNQATAGLSVNAQQLDDLPSFPSGVSVRAIAGNVAARHCLVWGCATRPTGDDRVVSTESATALHTNDGNGDGNRVFECTTSVWNPIEALLRLGSTWCDHVGMLGAPQVQSDVKASIAAYLASIKPEPVTPPSSSGPSATDKAYGMLGMTLRLDSDWEVRGNDSNGWTVKTDGTYAGYYTPSFEVMDASWLGDQSIATYGDFPECTDKDHSNPGVKLVRQGERPVGNQRAAYYTAKLCTDGAAKNELFRVWEVMAGSKRIVISTTEWPRYGVTNLDAVLANATWN